MGTTCCAGLSLNAPAWGGPPTGNGRFDTIGVMSALFDLSGRVAVEFGPHNIRVNCVAPGIIKTDFARALWQNPTIAKASEATTPLRRLGDPDDVAGAVVLLCSPAGRYITGQNLVIDGGATIASSSARA